MGAAIPARAVPMTSAFGSEERVLLPGHDMGHTRWNLLVAAWADVGLLAAPNLTNGPCATGAGLGPLTTPGSHRGRLLSIPTVTPRHEPNPGRQRLA